jgi:hypothetical protein
MKQWLFSGIRLPILLTVSTQLLFCHLKAQTLAEHKKRLELAPNPFQYVKETMKKKFRVDTVSVISPGNYQGLEDSIAYVGKTGKVYGPFRGNNILLQVLAKVPNTFYRIDHIVLDTGLFKPRFADSLAQSIITRIRSGETSFSDMAATYSADSYTAMKGGKLDWMAKGAMLPELEAAISNKKKGELFKLWTPTGLHIIRIAENPMKADGHALLLRIFL